MYTLQKCKRLIDDYRIGAFATSLGLPLVCYLASFLCNDISGCPVPSALSPSTLTLEKLKQETGWPGVAGLIDAPTTVWVLAYYFLSLVLYTFLPGVNSQGVVLASGGRLDYKFNGRMSSLRTSGYSANPW
jgi:delta14-sterol reductase